MSDSTTRVTRKGSGRTKGSFSFVVITLGDLKKKFSDDTQPIQVGRKWAETQGFTGLVAKPAANSYDTIQGVTPENKVQAVVMDLNS